jgi:DNA uptake protein ComE-like DNA-binding protein
MKQNISLSSQKLHVNEMDQDDWVALGLSQKQAEVTTKLIKKKQVHKFEELLNIKFIPPFIKEKYQKQFDFRIKPRTQAAKVNQEKSTIHEKFDLNSINSRGLRTSCEMDSLEIKSFFIYRKRLGGFQSENQIAEIAGIDSVSKRILMEYGLADTGLITKIPINHISIKDLSKHPYFSYNLATAIVNYRYKHGPYQSVGDLKKLVVMTPELFEKIRHYIRTEP